jgi:hypothetical protein
MKTKAEIVQRLLDEKKIDAEEAVILLMEVKDVTLVPYYPQPYWPTPYWSIFPQSPIVNYGNTASISFGITAN